MTHNVKADPTKMLEPSGHIKTSQELRMLSSVTIDCQITKIVMDSGSQLSELLSVSQRSQVSGIAP